MSKLTKALEKAARERLLRQEQATVSSKPLVVPIAPVVPIAHVATPQRTEIDPHIIAATDSKSPIAEQYRILRTNLQSLRLRPGTKTIVVTSAIHGEGKSVTSVNLALTLARQENLRVLLVDADLRKGSIQKWLGLAAKADGLSTALQRGGELNGSLLRLTQPPLTVLPAGLHPEHPAELLESSSMKRLLATLKTQFDYIVIDAPPVLPVADPGILAALADGVLLVVKSGGTQRRIVLQAQALLKQMNANLLGCVLTHVEYYLPGYYRYYHQYQQEQKKSNGHATPNVPQTHDRAATPPVAEVADSGDAATVA